jgi:hypothetical protein
MSVYAVRSLASDIKISPCLNSFLSLTLLKILTERLVLYDFDIEHGRASLTPVKAPDALWPIYSSDSWGLDC